MIRDDHQLSEVCRTICGFVRLGNLWKAPPGYGPSDFMRSVMANEAKFPGWSSGEIQMVLLAWTFWNGAYPYSNAKKPPHSTGLFDFYRWLTNSSHLAVIGDLLIAWAEGGDAIDRWLKEYAVLAVVQRKDIPTVKDGGSK